MRTAHVSIVIALALASGSPAGPQDALAGRHQGGTLIVHDMGMAGSALDPPPMATPASCAEADAEAAAGTDAVWLVLAAFPAGSSPRLSSLGLIESFSPDSLVITAGGLADSTSASLYPYDGWPVTPGGYSFIRFAAPQTERLVPLCWFAGYSLVPGATFRLSPPGFFFDELDPWGEDIPLGYGRLGFGVAGANVCPSPLGACCTCEDDCRLLTREECGDRWWEMDTTCDPNPCLPVSGLDGACCLPDGRCLLRVACRCAEGGGIFHGTDSDCGPLDPCRTPVEAQSWGRIKARYR